MREEFIDAIDDCAESSGITKSALIRDAVYDKLANMGLRVPKSVTYPPGRIRRKKKK
jgi:hypothetical protein